MQNIIIDKPYLFVPPRRGQFWPAVFRFWLDHYLDRDYGIELVECRGIEHLQNSLAAGHGILLAPNHCRPCDPMVMGILGRAVGRYFFTMASWHLFMQSRFQAWLLPRLGAFSVYREGMDREALKEAINILKEARRPLVLFPEGVVSRTNDRLGNLMDGLAFIARSAAKQRLTASPPGKVVVHPVAIRYTFGGEVKAVVTPVLAEIEARLSWRPQNDLPLTDRIYKVGHALLCLKEMEYLGQPQAGEMKPRLVALINHLLVPLEKEWVGGQSDGEVVTRVKRLRFAILPDMVKGELAEEERARRWRQLADIYLARQLSFYQGDYIASNPTAERILETVERFEEDLTDQARIHRPLRAVIRVGEALEVDPARDKNAAHDPLMEKLRQSLETMLAIKEIT